MTTNILQAQRKDFNMEDQCWFSSFNIHTHMYCTGNENKFLPSLVTGFQNLE